MKHRLSLAAFVLACAAARAQDSLAVTFNGDVWYLDTLIPRMTRLNAIPNPLGQNALARDSNGIFWSTARGSTAPFFLTRIDPITGVATNTWSIPDVRGLAAGPGTDLYMVHEAPPPQTIDILSRIDTLTGIITQIGPTGFTGLQALAGLGGILFAWDINLGLITIDPRTGIGIDPYPGVAGPAMQTVWAQPDGRLFGAAGSTVYVIDISSGNVVPIGAVGVGFDIRGAESFGGFSAPVGTGCAGAAGAVVMSVRGLLTGFGRIETVSANHAPNVPGVLLLGFSTSLWGTIPLPLFLDPIFGTVNCNLYVSIDVTQPAITSSGSSATLGFQTNLTMAARGLTVYAQHLCLEPVPGGLSLSNAARIQIAP